MAPSDDRGQRLEHVARRGPLNRDQRVAGTGVDRDGIAGRADPGRNPGEVLDDVRGVHDQHEMLAVQPVCQHVVDERALRRGQRRILRLTVRELGGVVRGDLLDRGKRVLAGNLDLPHVADVEHPGAGAHRQVLLADAAVLDRHIPPAELDHASPKRAVPGVERRLFERAGGRLGHRVDLRSAGTLLPATCGIRPS